MVYSEGCYLGWNHKEQNALLGIYLCIKDNHILSKNSIVILEYIMLYPRC